MLCQLVTSLLLQTTYQQQATCFCLDFALVDVDMLENWCLHVCAYLGHGSR